jgi:ketosteroid isomerase-like protein
MKDKVLAYFEAFSNKNLESLSNMYAEDVSLVDWDVTLYGKDDVLRSNKELFDKMSVIEIKSYEPLIYASNNALACEIEIKLVDKGGSITFLGVVDVVEFNEEGKILQIRAYLGNEELTGV